MRGPMQMSDSDRERIYGRRGAFRRFAERWGWRFVGALAILFAFALQLLAYIVLAALVLIPAASIMRWLGWL